jgi:phenazine biosynthesis protein phzE
MSLFDDALSRPAWALVRLRESDTVTVVGGERTDLEQLADIPLAEGAPQPGRRFDSLILVPYAQVRERGFEAHQDGTPLSRISIDTELEVPLTDAMALLPSIDLEFTDRGGFETDDDTYAGVVDAIIRTRSVTARARTWSSAAAGGRRSPSGTTPGR